MDFFDLSLDELEDIFEAYRRANSTEESHSGSLSEEDLNELANTLKRY